MKRFFSIAAATAVLIIGGAATANAAASIDGQDDINIVIEGEDGFEGITTLSANIGGLLPGETEMREGQDHGLDFITQFEMRIDADGNAYCVNEYEVVMSPEVMDDQCRLDRSDLTRGRDLTDIQPMPETVVETGPGYQNAVSLAAPIEILPISAEVEATEGISTGAAVGIGSGAAAVLAGGAFFLIRNKKAVA